MKCTGGYIGGRLGLIQGQPLTPDAITEAWSHLATARRQLIGADDPVIADHIRQAEQLLRAWLDGWRAGQAGGDR